MKNCGFITIIGRPNVGKSTLMNHLIGLKVSITSRKPQTTRHKIRGIINLDDHQFIFVDTPGFQKLHLNKLNQVLNKSVVNSLTDVNVVTMVVEAGLFNDGDQAVIDLLSPKVPTILVINKTDKIKDKQALLEYRKMVQSKYAFSHVLEISAKQHTNIDQMLQSLKKYMPSGPWLYPDEQFTDQPRQLLAAEIIREKLFRFLGQELPYSMTVNIEQFEITDTLYKISAVILVDKDSQKAIVIGKSGEKLKKISTDARIDMENLFKCKVFLQVWVKVSSGFADDLKFLKQFE